MEKYTGSIDVQFDGMPAIKLESYQPGYDAGVGERLAIATRRRRFTLIEDWHIELGDIGYQVGLNGTIEIPVRYPGSGEKIVFDGASIPVPWLISLLTIGILRPLGVALVGSIVHDYAYQYGTLRVISHEGSPAVEIPVERHKADRLFRDIIGTVNRLPPVGYIAWLAVRIGWLWVPYNNKKHTGKKPILEYIVAILIVAALYWLGTIIGPMWMIVAFLVLYFAAYITSLFLQRFMLRKR